MFEVALGLNYDTRLYNLKAELPHPLHLHLIIPPTRTRSDPILAPPRVHTLIQRHAHRVHLVDWPIKMRLEVPMRTKRFSDMSRTPVFRV